MIVRLRVVLSTCTDVTHWGCLMGHTNIVSYLEYNSATIKTMRSNLSL